METKFLLLIFSVISLIFCQTPATNPNVTLCAISTTCVPTGGVCGNSTGADPKKYCATGDFCDYLSSGNCIAQYQSGHACNSTYNGTDCAYGTCSLGVCTISATTAPPQQLHMYMKEVAVVHIAVLIVIRP